VTLVFDSLPFFFVFFGCSFLSGLNLRRFSKNTQTLLLGQRYKTNSKQIFRKVFIAPLKSSLNFVFCCSKPKPDSYIGRHLFGKRADRCMHGKTRNPAHDPCLPSKPFCKAHADSIHHALPPKSNSTDTERHPHLLDIGSRLLISAVLRALLGFETLSLWLGSRAGVPLCALLPVRVEQWLFLEPSGEWLLRGWLIAWFLFPFPHGTFGDSPPLQGAQLLPHQYHRHPLPVPESTDGTAGDATV
jgi:hypothetical protein